MQKKNIQMPYKMDAECPEDDFSNYNFLYRAIRDGLRASHVPAADHRTIPGCVPLSKVVLLLLLLTSTPPEQQLCRCEIGKKYENLKSSNPLSADI